ncbi:MAG: bifunctional diguanylate cyclase/phosphodiesterase [Synechococcus sp.]|nr:bifunctional diguanylate cyclase/phosphodiesterase [Synechococcus sp.]
MAAPLPLLRSWLKEEQRLLPQRSQRQQVGLAALLLFALLLAVEVRRRYDWFQASQHEQRQARMELISTALAAIRRTAFDWSRWDASHDFLLGRNPGFLSRELANTRLFSSGGVMVLFDQRGRPRISYSALGANQPALAPLVQCAAAALPALVDLSGAIPLLCRSGDGSRQLGVLTRVSSSDSLAPAVGSLVVFKPLIAPTHGPILRTRLQSFAAQLVPRSRTASEDLPGGSLLLGEGRQRLGLRPLSTLPLVWQSLRDDGLVILALLAPLLLVRIRLTLAHRRLRLQDLRQERRAAGRIRRVCRQLDQLLAELGLGAGTGSAPQRLVAELLGAANPAAPRPATATAATTATPMATGMSTPTPTPTPAPAPLDASMGGAASPTAAGAADAPTSTGVVAAARDQPPLEGRLHTLAQRFQRFLDGACSLARLDPLTQLPNRRFFIEQLALQARARDAAAARCALLFVDIDRFREINDSFSHSTGDQVLIVVANRLRQLVDRHDFLARHGSDEFVILHVLAAEAPQAQTEARAASLRFAERIAAAFDGPLPLDSLAINLSLSLGITLVQPELADPEVAIQQCVRAMGEAKRNKHTRIAIFDLDRNDPRDGDYNLYSSLCQAIRDHQLSVLFQPIVNGAGELQGVEALARWRHAERGWIAPELFVSLAERHRQMPRLSEELLCQALLSFRDIDPSIAADLALSINLSPSELEDPSLVPRILDQLEQHHFAAERLTLEITERGILELSTVVSANLIRLREQGIRLALDDFGTGHSSLSLLSQLRPDEVKIDRSFVAAIGHDAYALQIITLLGRMAPALGFQLVAEGVEDGDTLQRLQGLGIDRFQGFWFSRPAAAPVLPGQPD